MVVQERPQALRADGGAAPVRVLHHQHAVLQPLVEGAVSDEVEDVILAPSKSLLEGR